MFIYTVQQGDSLYRIGSKYSVPVEQIRLANGLNQVNIVPGQALLIPSYTYIVQPEDSFYTIAQMASVSVESLRRANPSINPARLQVGMIVRIPNISNYYVTSLGYYSVRTPQADQRLITDFSPYLTYIALFEYHFSPDGGLSTLNDLTAIKTAWSHRVKPLMTITNLTESGFSSQLTSQMLNNSTARNTLINRILQEVSTKGYDGVNIDFEMTLEKDRDLFTGFLRELRDRLKPAGHLLTIAVPPKTSDNIPWLKGYDYGGIGSVVDLMFIMAYDWHHSASEPGPVAPINEVRRTIQFAIDRVPRKKILLGLPLYGYDWTLPYNPKTIAPGISNQNAVRLAMQHQAEIHYSKEYESPYFYYVDGQGNRHVVGFEDARSISKKMQLIREFQIGGVGAWQLSLGFPEGPWLLTKFFHIKKLESIGGNKIISSLLLFSGNCVKEVRRFSFFYFRVLSYKTNLKGVSMMDNLATKTNKEEIQSKLMIQVFDEQGSYPFRSLDFSNKIVFEMFDYTLRTPLEKADAFSQLLKVPFECNLWILPVTEETLAYQQAIPELKSAALLDMLSSIKDTIQRDRTFIITTLQQIKSIAKFCKDLGFTLKNLEQRELENIRVSY
ncbi:hypothetical protein B5V88_02565 [Heyndrickxia sporothermodurans]|uniref:LysM peptidoglycan-binding domain-containing protein n=1 Tax=Heyndrickxia sporothermodurans TaxID=46224 RepID=A0AB37HQN3_9BACI|nr:LysM peptidoglycan-binding domain-containing protein [Heyndrickxia sporothermodurans]PTY81759.1 hypothetical protein B5V88_02565 [Heyndrickxia sporothermodurans]PTY85232.1 hypothetical protein B5V91_10665 [Heyndrickxia sporothermodurans]PTY91063.1 hypothetical protein B5V90_05630 [Heyndrickxia sporothermodurans]QQX27258.1 LysM peptidoglycan-binding domain-containing protein [Heyndrickxia sporothermodurans]